MSGWWGVLEADRVRRYQVTEAGCTTADTFRKLPVSAGRSLDHICTERKEDREGGEQCRGQELPIIRDAEAGNETWC